MHIDNLLKLKQVDLGKFRIKILFSLFSKHVLGAALSERNLQE